MTVTLSQLDPQQISKAVFDPTNNAIKVHGSIAGTSEISISQADDSIQVVPYRGLPTDRSVTATTSAAVLAAANPARKYLLIQNNDASIAIWVSFTGTASAGAGSFKISAGASMVFEGGFVPTTSASVISASGTVQVSAMEG